MRPRIIRNSRSKQVVVHTALQGLLVEVEYLLGVVGHDVRRKSRAEPMPECSVLKPRRKFFDLDVTTGKEKWRGQVAPNREAAEEDQMQFIRERVYRVISVSKLWVTPSSEDFTVDVFDRD